MCVRLLTGTGFVAPPEFPENSLNDNREVVRVLEFVKHDRQEGGRQEVLITTRRAALIAMRAARSSCQVEIGHQGGGLRPQPQAPGVAQVVEVVDVASQRRELGSDLEPAGHPVRVT